MKIQFLIILIFAVCIQANSDRYGFLEHFHKFHLDREYERSHTSDSLLTVYFSDFDQPKDSTVIVNQKNWNGIDWEWLDRTWNLDIAYDGFNKVATAKFSGSGGFLMFLHFKWKNGKWILTEYHDVST